jgi:hypothetical protein
MSDRQEQRPAPACCNCNHWVCGHWVSTPGTVLTHVYGHCSLSLRHTGERCTGYRYADGTQPAAPADAGKEM